MFARWSIFTELALAALLALGVTACGASTDGESDADAGTDNDGVDSDAGVSRYDFDQPTTGLVVATPKSDGTTSAIFAMQGDNTTQNVIVTDTAVPEGSGEHPVIVSLSSTKLHPMQTLVITAADLNTDGAAVSVVFAADGAIPVAVPAIAVTPRTVEVVVPPLFDANGTNVGGIARVRVLEFRSTAFTASAYFDGVEVSELPTFEASTPGRVLAAYLDAAVLDLDDVLAAPPSGYPDTYLSTMATLRDDLEQLRANVILVSSNPGQPTQLPTTRGASVEINIEAIELADRLVLAMLVALGESTGLGESSWKSDQRTVLQPEVVCPMVTGDPALDAQICAGRQGNRAVLLAPPLFAAGYKFLVSSWLGFYGGFGAIVVGAESAEAAAAFEMAWAAATGHIAAWATGTAPPTSGQTQADVGVTLVDRLAGTNGVISGVYSSLMFGQELDTIVRQGLPPIDEPDAGADAGTSDAGPDDPVDDAGTDTGGTGTLYEGTFIDSETFDLTGEGCVSTLTLTTYVTIPDFQGSGTTGDPYRGAVELFGNVVVVAPGGDGCDSGTVEVAPIETTLRDAAGVVEFSAMGLMLASDLLYEFYGGDVSPGRISGRMEVDLIVQGVHAFTWSGPLILDAI